MATPNTIRKNKKEEIKETQKPEEVKEVETPKERDRIVKPKTFDTTIAKVNTPLGTITEDRTGQTLDQQRQAGKALATPTGQLDALVKQDASKFGLEKPGQQNITPIDNLEVTQLQDPNTDANTKLDILGRALFGNQINSNVLTGQPNIDQETGQPIQSFGGASPFAAVSIPGGAAAAATAAEASQATTIFEVGGETILGTQNAVRAGNAAKTSGKVATALDKLKGLGGFTLAAFGISKIADATINRKVDKQQQALNTLGQLASTIVGDSTTGAGDYKKGINELRNIKKEILALEKDIKAGTIGDATLKFNGDIIDINSDIFDQLATLDEGIRDLQSFALEGAFPDLSPLEIQEQLRSLEADGHIKPVDFSSSRRDTSGEGVKDFTQ